MLVLQDTFGRIPCVISNTPNLLKTITIFDPFLAFAARKIRFVFQVEDYETLSPYMMDILSMRATPLPTTLVGSTRCTHEKKKKKDATGITSTRIEVTLLLTLTPFAKQLRLPWLESESITWAYFTGNAKSEIKELHLFLLFSYHLFLHFIRFSGGKSFHVTKLIGGN